MRGLIEVNLRFPGQYFDRETGKHYNYFRDYVPRLGRYAQSDPIGLNGALSTFSFAEVNPVGMFDRLGLFPDEDDFSFSFCVDERCICRFIGGCDNSAFRESLEEAGECLLNCTAKLFGSELFGAAAAESTPQFLKEAARGVGKISTGFGLAQLLICVQECEGDDCK